MIDIGDTVLVKFPGHVKNHQQGTIRDKRPLQHVPGYEYKVLFDVNDIYVLEDRYLVQVQSTAQNALLKAWQEVNGMYEFPFISDSDETISNKCVHEEKLYTGLVEQFYYCVKCNEKLERKVQ